MKAKKISLNRFIYSIGIRHIGQENAKTLAGFFGEIKKFERLFLEDNRNMILKNLIELDGIGETRLTQFKIFSLIKKIQKL